MVRPPVSFGIQPGLVNIGRRHLRFAVGGYRHGANGGDSGRLFGTA